MQINYAIIVPVIIVLAALLAWLMYRNVKDEKKFEHDIDEKDDLEEEREKKKTQKPL